MFLAIITLGSWYLTGKKKEMRSNSRPISNNKVMSNCPILISLYSIYIDITERTTPIILIECKRKRRTIENPARIYSPNTAKIADIELADAASMFATHDTKDKSRIYATKCITCLVGLVFI